MSRMIAILAAVVAVGGGALFLFGQGGGSTPVDPLGSVNAQEASEIDTSGIVEMSVGNADAPVTVIEYASFTCPHCATFHANGFKRLKTDFIDTGKINFIYREVYFDRYSLWASMIARCAGPEKFFGMSELIYSSQSEWSRAGEPTAIVDELRKIGRLAGLGNEQLEACLQDGDKAQALVAWYKQNAEKDGIESTPSFVINGKKYTNMAYEDMADVIVDAAK